MSIITTHYFPPGVSADTSLLKPGNFGLTHAPGALSKLIRFGQWLRFHGSDASFYSHAFGIIDDKGTNIAMVGSGAQKFGIDQYTKYPFHIVDPGLTDIQRQSAVEFWEWAYQKHVKYGYIIDVSEGITCLLGGKLQFGTRGTMICSGMVAAGLGLPKWRANPSHIFPIELAIEYGVKPVKNV